MFRQAASIAITLGLFFLFLFTYTKLAGPIPLVINSINTTKSTTFDVTGEGTATTKPDSATVSAGVSATGSTSAGVQDQMNSAINKVSLAVKNVGIDPKDIQTSNYNINPSYDFGSGQRITGYNASTSLTIKVKDISKINSVLDAATAAGATNVNNLGFNTTDKSAAEAEARKKAIAQAKAKAQETADTVGFKLGSLVNYSEGTNGVPRPIPLLDKAVGTSAGVPTQVEPGSNEVHITVTLSYEVR